LGASVYCVAACVERSGPEATVGGEALLTVRGGVGAARGPIPRHFGPKRCAARISTSPVACPVAADVRIR